MSDRRDAALAEIQRRLTLAEAATQGPWHYGDCSLYPYWILTDGKSCCEDAEGEPCGYADEVLTVNSDLVDEGFGMRPEDWAFMREADPAREIAVLEGHRATLERHVNGTRSGLPLCDYCQHPLGGLVTPADCPDAAHVLDLYARRSRLHDRPSAVAAAGPSPPAAPHVPTGRKGRHVRRRGQVMSFDDYLRQVWTVQREQPEWRPGQTYFNVLHAVRPDLSAQVRASRLDPFYMNHRIDAFLEWTLDHWEVTS